MSKDVAAVGDSFPELTGRDKLLKLAEQLKKDGVTNIHMTLVNGGGSIDFQKLTAEQIVAGIPDYLVNDLCKVWDGAWLAANARPFSFNDSKMVDDLEGECTSAQKNNLLTGA